jgi:cobalamin biosynthesis Mg chelatase CobN
MTPTIQQPCVNDITSGGSIGGCKALDIKCVCENGSLLDNLACCLEKNCDEAGKEAAVKYAAQICGSAGVKDIPTEVVCKSEASKTGESSSKTESKSDESKTAGAAEQTKTGEQSSTETGEHHTTSGTHTAADQATRTSESSTESTSTGEAMGLNAPVGMVGAAILGMLAL